jgi:hypothetical protein
MNAIIINKLSHYIITLLVLCTERLCLDCAEHFNEEKIYAY